VYVPTPITLTLTGDAGTLPCAALLEFSGDDTAFTCYEIEGQELVTPVVVGSLPLNVRYLSWEQGTAITIKFYPVFVDGTAKSCTITIKDGAGVVVGTETLSATFADPVVGAVNSAGNVLHFFTAQDVATGVKGANGIVADDLENPASSDYKLYARDAVKEVVEGLLPGVGSSRLLSRYIKTTTTDETKCVGIKVAHGTTPVSGWFIIYRDAWNDASGDVKCAGGIYMSPSLPSYSRAYWWTGNLGIRFSNYTAVTGAKAYFVGFRYDGVNTNWYFSDMEGTWADLVTYAVAGNLLNAGATWFNDANQSGQDLRLLPGSLHGADVGAAALEAIYDACKA